MLTIRHLLFTPLYGARILNRPYGTFFRGLVPISLATLATIGLCRFILWHWPISNWLELGTAGWGVSMLFVGVVYFLITPEERLALKAAVALSRNKA